MKLPVILVLNFTITVSYAQSSFRELSTISRTSPSIEKDASITVSKSVKKTAPDTMKIIFWDHVLSHEIPRYAPNRIIASMANNNNYTFNVENISGIGYFSMNVVYKRNSALKYIVEPGDSVHIDDKQDYLSFSGRGAPKYTCIYTLNSTTSLLNDIWNNTHYIGTKTDSEVIRSIIAKYDWLLNEQLKIVDFYRQNMKSDIVNLIKVNLLALKLLNIFDVFRAYYQYNSQDGNIETKKQIVDLYHLYIRPVEKEIADIEEDLIIRSENYAAALLNKLMLEGQFEKISKVDLYNRIKLKFSSEVRDKLFAIFFIDEFKRIPNVDSLLSDALSITSTSYCYEALTTIANNVLKGSIAYNFALPDTSGNFVNLSDFKGKVVFIDFWYTGCGPCAVYYEQCVSKAKKAFKDRSDVVFVSISIDKRRSNWVKGIYSGKYTSPEIVNLFTNGQAAEHPIIKHYQIRGYPRPILIDKVGKIYSATNIELRYGGPEKLIKTISEALGTED